jgi:hypothetical protein
MRLVDGPTCVGARQFSPGRALQEKSAEYQGPATCPIGGTCLFRRDLTGFLLPEIRARPDCSTFEAPAKLATFSQPSQVSSGLSLALRGALVRS